MIVKKWYLDQEFLVFRTFFFNYFTSSFKLISEISEFLKNLIQSDGILSSIQFAFTALLTLLIPLIIFAFEERRELKNSKYNNLKKVTQNLIDSKLDIQRKLYLIVSAGIVIIFWNNNGDQNIWQINLIILIVLGFLFGFLVKEIQDVINFLNQSLDESIANHIKNSTALSETKREWFDEYFSKSSNSEEKQTQEERENSKNILVTMLEMFYTEVDKNLESNPYLASGFLDIFKENIDSLVKQDSSFYIAYKNFNNKTILQKIFEWHFKTWSNFIKKMKEGKAGEANIYVRIEMSLADLIQKIQIYTIQKNWVAGYDFWQNIKESMEKNSNYQVIEEVENGKHIFNYCYRLPIWNTLFENIEKSKMAGYYSIKDFFPEDWKITLSIDFEKNKFNNIVSKVWLLKFNEWFFNTFQTEYRRQENDSFDIKVKLLLGLLFPKIDYRYWSIVLWYWAGFSWQDKQNGRIAKMTKDYFPNWDIVDDGYEMAEYYNNEEGLRKKYQKKLKNKEDLTIKLTTSLFKIDKNFDFTKNLPEDLAEIKNLKAKFETKAELTYEENEQFERLKIIQEIWTKIYENLKS